MNRFFRSVIILCALSPLTSINATELFSTSKTYALVGTHVRFSELNPNTGMYLVGHFQNKWYTTGATKPKFYPNDGPWEAVTKIITVTNPPGKAEISGIIYIPEYQIDGAYSGNFIVKGSSGTCYQSKWWTRDNPETGSSAWNRVTCPTATNKTLTAIDDSTNNEDSTAGSPASCGNGIGIPDWQKDGTYLEGNAVMYNGGLFYVAKWWNKEEPPASKPETPWSSPWIYRGNCAPIIGPNGATTSVNLGDSDSTLPPGITPPPVINHDTSDDAAEEATNNAASNTDITISPAIPPVIPGETVESSKPITAPAPTQLPDTGYAFLRLVTTSDWNWLFPLRSGKFVSKNPCNPGQFQNCGGGERNDGSNDIFTLDAFVRAVLEYNNWAEVNNYKQFLNEGNAKQQAQEFISFWAKSSRETSGSWGAASEPWIVKHRIAGEDIWAWKGGLYWIEEMGYSTDPNTGKSVAVSYVDKSSVSYPPAPGRSYYGRGIIQLSWNYNYGAFSHWLYDNGIFRQLITERDKLLKYPNLIADNGALSILSGIWFWMTPQGAKPSSHDVLYGDVSNISISGQDPGLPQSNSLNIDQIPRAQGDTSNQAAFSYRLGTITNIVNGGLECNKAAKWHGGPVQRGLYYDVYAAYFNEKYSIGAIRIDYAKANAKTTWLSKISDASPVNLQSATCYNQKSYYGW